MKNILNFHVKLLPWDPSAIWKRNKHRIETEKNRNLQTQQPPPVQSSWFRPCQCGVSQSRYRHRQITFKATFLRFPIIVNLAAGWLDPTPRTKVCARGIKRNRNDNNKKSTQKSIKVPTKQCCSGPGHTQVNKRQVRSIPRDMACARVASCLGEEWTGHWLRLHRQSVHYCCNTDRFLDMGNLFPMQFSHPTQMSWARAFDRLFTGEICVCLEVWRRVLFFFCCRILLWFEG